MFEMRKGNERERVFKIQVNYIFTTSLKLLGAHDNNLKEKNIQACHPCSLTRLWD